MPQLMQSVSSACAAALFGGSPHASLTLLQRPAACRPLAFIFRGTGVAYTPGLYLRYREAVRVEAYWEVLFFDAPSVGRLFHTLYCFRYLEVFSCFQTGCPLLTRCTLVAIIPAPQCVLV